MERRRMSNLSHPAAWPRSTPLNYLLFEREIRSKLTSAGDLDEDARNRVSKPTWPACAKPRAKTVRISTLGRFGDWPRANPPDHLFSRSRSPPELTVLTTLLLKSHTYRATHGPSIHRAHAPNCCPGKLDANISPMRLDSQLGQRPISL